jgi:hypothetical protein
VLQLLVNSLDFEFFAKNIAVFCGFGRHFEFYAQIGLKLRFFGFSMLKIQVKILKFVMIKAIDIC